MAASIWDSATFRDLLAAPDMARLVSDTAEIRFTVRGESRELGMVRLPHRWLDGGGDPQ